MPLTPVEDMHLCKSSGGMKGMRKQGLTLTELLIVLVLMAVLGALLYPVLMNARETARQSVCLSNLKQIGIGLGLYLQDWGTGKCEIANFGLPPSLFHLFPHYVSSKEVFRCPNDPCFLCRRRGSIVSYGYQVWVGDGVPPNLPPSLHLRPRYFCAEVAKRPNGLNDWPIVYDLPYHHNSPEQVAYGPVLWLILRGDGRVEKKVTGGGWKESLEL